MKLQCDVCGVEAATVICYADEAVLCGGCDACVHSANKLAGKHRRVSLLHPSSKTLPLCDICKEKSGFVFCQDDRAILCKDCDLHIHSSNTNAGKHIRFLLSGIRFSTAQNIPFSSSAPAPTSAAEMVASSVTAAKSCRSSEEDAVCSRHSTATTTENDISGGSTISDYLMNKLPGWRVDDFLLDDATNAGDLLAGHLTSEQAVEMEAAAGGGGSRAWGWSGGAVAKMEDLQVWMTPFPAAHAVSVAQERVHPLLDYREWVWTEVKDEVSMVTQFQYQKASKKRSMASFWY